MILNLNAMATVSCGLCDYDKPTIRYTLDYAPNPDYDPEIDEGEFWINIWEEVFETVDERDAKYLHIKELLGVKSCL
jgi:hypothetical protein